MEFEKWSAIRACADNVGDSPPWVAWVGCLRGKSACLGDMLVWVAWVTCFRGWCGWHACVGDLLA